jgi:hypothetical protein
MRLLKLSDVECEMWWHGMSDLKSRDSVHRITPCISLTFVRPVGRMLDEDWSACRISPTQMSFPSFSFILCFFMLMTQSVTKLLKLIVFPQVYGWSVRRIIVSRSLAANLLWATPCSIILNSSETHLTVRSLKYIYWHFRDLLSCFRKISYTYS